MHRTLHTVTNLIAGTKFRNINARTACQKLFHNYFSHVLLCVILYNVHCFNCIQLLVCLFFVQVAIIFSH